MSPDSHMKHEKTMEKGDFNQRSECTVPNCLSKYTTSFSLFISLSLSVCLSVLIYLFSISLYLSHPSYLSLSLYWSVSFSFNYHSLSSQLPFFLPCLLSLLLLSFFLLCFLRLYLTFSKVVSNIINFQE